MQLGHTLAPARRILLATPHQCPQNLDSGLLSLRTYCRKNQLHTWVNDNLTQVDLISFLELWAASIALTIPDPTECKPCKVVCHPCSNADFNLGRSCHQITVSRQSPTRQGTASWLSGRVQSGGQNIAPACIPNESESPV